MCLRYLDDHHQVPLQPVFHAVTDEAATSASSPAETETASMRMLLRVAVIAEEQLSVGMGDRVQLVLSGEEMQHTDVTARVREVTA